MFARAITWGILPKGKCGASCDLDFWPFQKILIHVLYGKVKVERIWYGITGSKCHYTRGLLEDPFVKRKVKEKRRRRKKKTHKQTNVDNINYTNLSAQQRILNSVIINQSINIIKNIYKSRDLMQDYMRFYQVAHLL